MSSIKSGSTYSVVRLTRKTVPKSLRSGKGSSESRPIRDWRTSKDPFVDVSKEIRGMLEKAPELETLTIH
ncbi:MAG: hypothetical protein KAG97_05475 [Victivallales bacterium]|nr:hypothetical protein [Victivallales bacterium]